MNYEFNFLKLIIQYLSPDKRGSVRVSWLYVLTSYIKNIHESFLATFNEIKDEIKWSGSTICLERYLQIKFNLPSLKIINQNLQKNQFGYPCPDERNIISSGRNSALSPLSGAPDLVQGNHGFEIQINQGEQYNSTELEAIVSRRLIGGATFIINEV